MSGPIPWKRIPNCEQEVRHKFSDRVAGEGCLE
jgi:hypothetical protein